MSKKIIPAQATIGQTVKFTYKNKDGVESERTGVVDSAHIDRFLLIDSTENQPRMFLFPRISNCELVEVEAAPKKNLGFYLRRIFGLS